MKRLFPDDEDYTAVYDRFGLLGTEQLVRPRRPPFANASARGSTRPARRSSTARPPTPFWARACSTSRICARHPRPVAVGLATDVGGGTSYSMLATMAEAYKVAMLRGTRLTAVELFHMATRGNAGLLGLDGETGALEPGAFADLVVLDPRATPVLASRDEISKSLEDRLFALALLGDDRAVSATYVAGKRVHLRKGHADTCADFRISTRRVRCHARSSYLRARAAPFTSTKDRRSVS